jgi:hypothetical protein
MSNSQAIYDRYQVACEAHSAACISDPSIWHHPDVAEFSELLRLLKPHAESGDMRCQYAVASILWLGLCCESEEQMAASQDSACEEASRWWITLAKQGFTPALDNLVTSGVGPEAQHAREAWRQLARERHDLVGSSCGMPVYGPEFIEELSRRLYGRVIADAV